MFRVIRRIKNFFISIDNGLTAIETYIDQRVKTGKFIFDIKNLIGKVQKDSRETYKKKSKEFSKAKSTQHALSRLHTLYGWIMDKPILENIVTVFVDLAVIWSSFYLELLIAFIFSFLSTVVLIFLFGSFPIFFFVALPPILALNTIYLSGLYLYISKREAGESLSIIKAAGLSFSRFPSVLSLFSYYFSSVIILVLVFFLFSLFYTYFFDLLGIYWGNSFPYWVVVTTLGILLTAVIFMLTFLVCQAFYFVLFNGKDPFQAYALSFYLAREYSFQFFFFYLVLSIFSFSLIAIASNLYFYYGFGLTTLLFVQGIFFLGFLLRRKFITKNEIVSEGRPIKYTGFLRIVPILGIMTYILASIFIVRNYPAISNILVQERTSSSFSIDEKTYENIEYGYAVDYPANWTLYANNSKSVTIYNNSTGTQQGGVWMKINVSPFSKSEFADLRNSKSGLYSYNTGTKNILTKISNLQIDGYDAVKYTYLKNDAPFVQYQIHYLIHKNDREYEIVFTTVSKNLEEYNLELFDKIINSFRFIELQY